MKKGILKSILLIFLGMILGIILLIILTISIFSKFSASPIIVKNNTWLLLDFAGSISEKPVATLPSILGNANQKIELLSYTKAINNAATDPRINGIIINGDMTFYQKVHVEEIHSSLDKFKDQGKKVIAWLSNGINSNYNLCLAADQIYMPDTKNANLTITGYAQILPFYKTGLDNIGIEYNVVHIGEYKSTGEFFIRDSISEKMRSSFYDLNNSLYNKRIKEIVDIRKINYKSLSSLLSSGKTILMTPHYAMENGLIDGFKTYQEILEDISVEGKSNTVSIFDYSKTLSTKVKGNKIAIFYAEGIITNYFSGNNRFSGNITGAKSFIEDLDNVKKDPSVKAVIIRVNSPGGSALGSELIYKSIDALKKIKPVYISFGPIAASGGYYISSGANKIFASPSTITGSIGVVSILMNISELSKKLGLNFETIKKHKYDDFLSIYRKPTEEELNILKRSMQDVYDEFSGHVKTDRKIDDKKIEGIASGRVWTGDQAIKLNLADELGTLIDVIDHAVVENDIADHSIISFPKPPTLFERISNINQIKLNIYGLEELNIENIKEMVALFKDTGIKPCLYFPYFINY